MLYQYTSTEQSAGKWCDKTSPSCPHSIPRTSGEYSRYSGQTKSLTKTYCPRCKQDMVTIIIKSCWRWIGHVLRREDGSNIKTALHWTPDGKRKRGRPKITWRRTGEQELKSHHHTWGTIGTLACDRQKWKDFVAALCAFGAMASK